MKTNASFLRQIAASAALLLAAATQVSLAQTTATTDPVGFITLTARGGGTLSNPKYSLLSPTLTQPISWQGAVTAVSSNTSGPTTITVSGTPWTAGQFNGANGSYYVEVVTISPNTHPTGVISVITGTTTSTITTSDNLFAFASVGDTIRIRADVTLSTIFGATNTAGLLASDDPSTGDEVLVYDGATSKSYFYYTGSPGFPTGWWDSAFTAQAGSVVIGPHQGVVIKRKANAAVTFTVSGAVKTGNTLFPVVTGINVLGTISSQGLTLDSSGLYTGSAITGVKPSDDPSTADEITIYTATTQTNYFYYTGSPGFPAGWWDSAFTTQAGSVAIAPGTAFVLNRKGGGVSFNWSLPSPSSF